MVKRKPKIPKPVVDYPLYYRTVCEKWEGKRRSAMVNAILRWLSESYDAGTYNAKIKDLHKSRSRCHLKQISSVYDEAIKDFVVLQDVLTKYKEAMDVPANMALVDLGKTEPV